MRMPPIAAVEIGTTRTVVCVGEDDEQGRMSIAGYGHCPTIGVRKGQIFDIEQARAGLETAVRQAERASNVSVWQVLLAIAGGHIQSNVNSGRVAIRAADRVVTREDVEEVVDIANSVPLDADRQIVHTIRQSFTLDDQPDIFKPEGMRCNMLMLNVLAIHGAKNRIDNVVSVVKNMQIEVLDVAFSGICAVFSTLKPEQKKNGALLIDLGGGTTSYVAFCNDLMVTAGCLAVGGDHVTNDIAVAFNIPQTRAEELKRTEGCAMLETEGASRRILLAADIGFDERLISAKALHTVIHARMDETFRIVRSRLDEAGVLPHLGSGIVLTGGGAYLRKAKDLAARVFGLPCQIGLPVNVSGLGGVEQPAAFATVAGLVCYGKHACEDRSMLSPIKKLLKGVLRR